MKRPLNMLENGSHRDAQEGGGSGRYRGTCDKWFAGFILVALIRTGEALAGDQVVIAGDALKPDFNFTRPTGAPAPPAFTVPDTYLAPALPETKIFSSRDFRPRGPSVYEQGYSATTSQDTPMLRSTTVWQRLSDYRTRGRVRVLTLWETGDSTFSLQAGRKGEPSLQWTSRLMNHGGATRGVLDQLFATSIAGASRGMHFSPRASSTELSTKPAKGLDSGLSK